MRTEAVSAFRARILKTSAPGWTQLSNQPGSASRSWETVRGTAMRTGQAGRRGRLRG